MNYNSEGNNYFLHLHSPLLTLSIRFTHRDASLPVRALVASLLALFHLAEQTDRSGGIICLHVKS